MKQPPDTCPRIDSVIKTSRTAIKAIEDVLIQEDVSMETAIQLDEIIDILKGIGPQSELVRENVKDIRAFSHAWKHAAIVSLRKEEIFNK